MPPNASRRVGAEVANASSLRPKPTLGSASSAEAAGTSAVVVAVSWSGSGAASSTLAGRPGGRALSGSHASQGSCSSAART
jgi:hypothetical protein